MRSRSFFGLVGLALIVILSGSPPALQIRPFGSAEGAYLYYSTFSLLFFSFFSLYNGKRNAEFLWAAVDTRLNDDRTAATHRTRLVGGREGIGANLTQQEHIAGADWCTAAVFKPLNIRVFGRYTYFSFFAGA